MISFKRMSSCEEDTQSTANVRAPFFKHRILYFQWPIAYPDQDPLIPKDASGIRDHVDPPPFGLAFRSSKMFITFVVIMAVFTVSFALFCYTTEANADNPDPRMLFSTLWYGVAKICEPRSS